MSIWENKSKIAMECINGKSCSQCIECSAELDLWEKLQDQFNNENYIDHDLLKTYYTIKSKWETHLQINEHKSLVLGEAETLEMLGRY